MVVAADREADLTVVRHREAAVHGLLLAVNLLIEHRLAKDDVAVALRGCNLEAKLAARLDDRARAVDRQTNLAGVTLRRDHEVILQLAFRAVVDEIDAGVGLGDAGCGVSGNADVVLRLVAGDVVDVAGQRTLR